MPPKEWMHDNTIKGKDDETLKECLGLNILPIP